MFIGLYSKNVLTHGLASNYDG